MANTDKKETAEVIQPILVKNVNLMQFQRQVHECITRTRLTLEQLQDERTWAFAATKLRMYDRLEIMDELGSQLAHGIVTYINGTNVKVQIYGLYPLSEASQKETEYRDYIVRWAGVIEKWTIVGKETGKSLRGDFPTDISAIKYLEDHYKALLA
jgi:hypothetical protein